MRRVLLYSVLLILGLAASQILPRLTGDRYSAIAEPVRLATMACLAFIMIHVGYEFEIDKSRMRQYGWDYVVAGTAASFPWVFCAAYFVMVMSPAEEWTSADRWKETLLVARFAAPTSAGVLFSMLAAAGLSATWVFRKVRVLAIFDDLDTVLLMIPLKMMIVGARWELGMVVVIMLVLLWAAWRYLHRWRIPVSWPYVTAYAVVITGACEAVYLGSKLLSDVVAIHLEVLLPAFVLGCVMARPSGVDPHVDDTREGHQEGPESPAEQRVAAVISGAFMVLVGLSMPSLGGKAADGGAVGPGWALILLHVLLITLVANLGKMFPVLCYRREAHWRERLAVAVSMFPRGEVGAGVLVVSLSYGIGGPMVTVAVLSLALNLLLTGVFIIVVQRLIALSAAVPAARQ